MICDGSTRPIPGFPGYFAKIDGVIFGKKCTPLTPVRCQPRYETVGLYRDRVYHRRSIGHLVLLTFVGPPTDGQECCHGPAGFNCHALSNLRWGTKSDNARDRKRDGSNAHGERHGRCKLTEADVIEILNDDRSTAKIGLSYGVARSTIQCIKNGRSWQHVNRATR